MDDGRPVAKTDVSLETLIMKWASALSTQRDPDRLVADLTQRLRQKLGEDEPDLLMVFIGAPLAPGASHIAALLDQCWPGALRIGCLASGVIGDGIEIEDQHAVSVSAAVLPKVALKPFHVDLDQMPDADAPPQAWHELLKLRPCPNQTILLLIDPFHTRIEAMLAGLDFAFPNACLLGGLVSGASVPGENRLYLHEHEFRRGAIGISLSGNLQVDPVVSQGCKPIGPVGSVTQSVGNQIEQINGLAALEIIQGIGAKLPPREQKLMRSGLLVGLAPDDLRSDEGPDHEEEYLIRNLVGVDYGTGSIVVGANIREGQRIRFHLRDRNTAREELLELLARKFGVQYEGALLFSCLGRGEYLYKIPNHDSACISDAFGGLYATGIFCNGEIGPVAGSTFVHGFTSVIGLVRPAEG